MNRTVGTKWLAFVVAGTALFAVAACGGTSPTGPTPAPPTPSASQPAGGTGGGNGSGGTGGGGGGTLVTVTGSVTPSVPLTGACPALRFGVINKQSGGFVNTVVNTDAATQYIGATCADVQYSVAVQVQGDAQSDLTLHAVIVRFLGPSSTVVAK